MECKFNCVDEPHKCELKNGCWLYDKPSQEQPEGNSEPMIPLSEVKGFAEYLGIKGWEYNKTFKTFIDSCNFDSGQTRTFESLYNEFKQTR